MVILAFDVTRMMVRLSRGRRRRILIRIGEARAQRLRRRRINKASVCIRVLGIIVRRWLECRLNIHGVVLVRRVPPRTHTSMRLLGILRRPAVNICSIVRSGHSGNSGACQTGSFKQLAPTGSVHHARGVVDRLVGLGARTSESVVWQPATRLASKVACTNTSNAWCTPCFTVLPTSGPSHVSCSERYSPSCIRIILCHLTHPIGVSGKAHRSLAKSPMSGIGVRISTTARTAIVRVRVIVEWRT